MKLPRTRRSGRVTSH